MTDRVDVGALARLARLGVSAEELEKLGKEIPTILDFVKTIEKASGSSAASPSELRNVMRQDKEPHESGVFTEALLRAAPKIENGRIVVKQVLKKK